METNSMLVGVYNITTHTVSDSIDMVFFFIVEHSTVSFLFRHIKKTLTYVTRARTFRRNIQTRDPNARGLIWVASFVRAITVSVFDKLKEEIMLYILYRTSFSHHLFCANGQTVQSQNIKYYGMPYFAAKNTYVSHVGKRHVGSTSDITICSDMSRHVTDMSNDMSRHIKMCHFQICRHMSRQTTCRRNDMSRYVMRCHRHIN